MERRRKERKVNFVTIMSIPFQIPKIQRKKKNHGFREPRDLCCDEEDNFEDLIKEVLWLDKHNPPEYSFKEVRQKNYQSNRQLCENIPGAFRPPYTPYGLWQYKKINKG